MIWTFKLANTQIYAPPPYRIGTGRVTNELKEIKENYIASRRVEAVKRNPRMWGVNRSRQVHLL